MFVINYLFYCHINTCTIEIIKQLRDEGTTILLVEQNAGKSLAISDRAYVLENGKIETTVTRAKEVSAMTEKYITIAKDNSLANKRQALSFITKEAVVKKLFDEIAPAYKERNGGYCRITKTGPRRGDAAEMAIIELVK